MGPKSPVASRRVCAKLRTPGGRLLLGSMEHPEVGRYEAVRSPIRVNGSRSELGAAPPLLGQHTGAVLAQLGLSSTEK